MEGDMAKLPVLSDCSLLNKPPMCCKEQTDPKVSATLKSHIMLARTALFALPPSFLFAAPCMLRHSPRQHMAEHQSRSVNQAALRAIKATHTIVWAVFVACIAGIPIAAWCGEHHAAAWLAATVFVEVLVLAVNGWRCPMTSMAARRTDERRENFDIYLPIWLARHNKLIFGALYIAGICFAFLQWSHSGISLIGRSLCTPTHVHAPALGATVMTRSQVENSTMLTTNQKQPDQTRIIASLASEFHVPIGEMATLYERARAELAMDAHITKYLHIFATRKVLEVLRRRGLDRQLLSPGEPGWLAA
jgi:hypothetical protein